MKLATKNAILRHMAEVEKLLRTEWAREESDVVGGALDRLGCMAEELTEAVKSHNASMARWRRKGR